MVSCKSNTYKIFHNELQLNLILQVNLQPASWSLSEDMVRRNALYYKDNYRREGIRSDYYYYY